MRPSMHLSDGGSTRTSSRVDMTPRRRHSSTCQSGGGGGGDVKATTGFAKRCVAALATSRSLPELACNHFECKTPLRSPSKSLVGETSCGGGLRLSGIKSKAAGLRVDVNFTDTLALQKLAELRSSPTAARLFESPPSTRSRGGAVESTPPKRSTSQHALPALTAAAAARSPKLSARGTLAPLVSPARARPSSGSASKTTMVALPADQCTAAGSPLMSPTKAKSSSRSASMTIMEALPAAAKSTEGAPLMSPARANSSSRSASKAVMEALPGAKATEGAEEPVDVSKVVAASVPSSPAEGFSGALEAAADVPETPAGPECVGLLSTSSKARSRLGLNLNINTTKSRPGTLRKRLQSKQLPPLLRKLGEKETIEDRYDFGQEIHARGGVLPAQVLLATRRSDGKPCVIKVRAKAGNQRADDTWSRIMCQLKGIGESRHVLDIFEIVEGKDEFYVVMPKCDGGELFDFLINEPEVPEDECKRIVREILTAVGHLHKNGLVHRDIKPENIMFHHDAGLQRQHSLDSESMVSPGTVKLIDFDTCCQWEPASPPARHFVGTRGYIAPEALQGNYCPQSDLWSVGVILYILMTGEMPWTESVHVEVLGQVGTDCANELYESIRAEVLDWEEEPWPEFPKARDLCRDLLAFKVADRIQSAEEALACAWLRD
eukprot:TRINITY_DN27108_c0_g1_i1.p1 TRINITY_DN27108_c0_g1~~TRINITY_DN27108_c0_g1_i1.p1  ORF type:complete len:664 (+),score=162.46 TRINITY_DN27108_c0_g1_i1:178-2169(+)